MLQLMAKIFFRFNNNTQTKLPVCIFKLFIV